jgi:hypothetical protein
MISLAFETFIASRLGDSNSQTSKKTVTTSTDDVVANHAQGIFILRSNLKTLFLAWSAVGRAGSSDGLAIGVSSYERVIPRWILRRHNHCHRNEIVL